MRNRHARLPRLHTFSLEGIVVPQAVAKEWRRRQQFHALSSGVSKRAGAGVVMVRDSGEREGKKTVPTTHREAMASGEAIAETALRGVGGEVAHDIGGDVADRMQSIKPKHGALDVARSLRRIKKMTSRDEQGIWLLNNLLKQIREEDREGLCRSVEEQLSKRAEILERNKDRTKLECDRRCVFTKAANEIRTSSEMIAESNRFNILTGIVKSHYHAKVCGRELLRHSATSAQQGDTTGSDEDVAAQSQSSLMKRFHPNAKGRTRSQELGTRASSKGCRSLHPTPSAVPSTTANTGEPQHAPQNSRVGRGSAASAPLKHPPYPKVEHPGAPCSLVSGGRSLSQGAGIGVGTGRAGQQLALPPLDQRYGVGVVDSWASSPVTLKFRRPRQRSVDIASLGFDAYAKFVATLVPPGALQSHEATTTQEGQEEEEEEEEEKEEQEQEEERGMGVDKQGILLPCSRENPQGRSFIVRPYFLPIREEGEQDGEVGDVTFFSGPCASRRAESTADLGIGAAVCEESHSCEGNRAGTEKEEGSSDDVRFLSDISRQRGGGLALPQRSPSGNRDGSQQEKGTVPNPTFQSVHNGIAPPVQPSAIGTGPMNSASCILRRTASTPSVGCRGQHLNQGPLASSHSQHTLVPVRESTSPSRLNGGISYATAGSGGKRGGNSTRAPSHDAWAREFPVADTLDATAFTFRSCGARKVFKQTQRLLAALRTPARSSLTSSGGHRQGGGGGKSGGHSSVIVHRPVAVAASPGVVGVIKPDARGGEHVGLRPNDPRMWRGSNKFGDKLARLAEVFRCVRPPHTVRIDSEIILFDMLGKGGEGGRQGFGGGGVGSGRGATNTTIDRGGPWDDLVHAWEYLGDGILAGRALFAYWEFADKQRRAAFIAPRSHRATGDLLSNGLMKALLFTRCYRPPGLDQVFIEWLDELLEAVRGHVRRGCSRLPLQHGLTAGVGWFQEVCNDPSFGRRV